MSAQPSPRSNLLQTLLLVTVLYLGFMLFFGPRNSAPPRELSAVQTAYDKALKERDWQKVSIEGYELALRLEGQTEGLSGVELQTKRAEVFEIKYQAADAKIKYGEAVGDYNEIVNGHTELGALAIEAKGTPAEVKAKARANEAIEIGKVVAKRSASSLIRFGYNVIDFLVGLTGRVPGLSYWLACLLLAIVVRAIAWPLATKQYVSFKRMALLQPLIKELQEKHQGQELQAQTMKLYQKYGINPFAGCWPILIQMPFFIWMYTCMQLYQFEFHNGTFLWISKAGAAAAPGIVAPNLGEKDVPLIILYGISMVVTSIISVHDPTNARQARMIGIVMGVLISVMMLLWPLPSAFILYWIGINVVSTFQTFWLRTKPIPPLVETAGGGKTNGFFKGLTPKEGPTGMLDRTERKTGAPAIHKPKGKKKK